MCLSNLLYSRLGGARDLVSQLCIVVESNVARGKKLQDRQTQCDAHASDGLLHIRMFMQ